MPSTRFSALAADVDADVAVALDPDADRCAIGVPMDGGWRMLSGDETGWLLGDYILSECGGRMRVVASTVVSSRMLALDRRRARRTPRRDVDRVQVAGPRGGRRYAGLRVRGGDRPLRRSAAVRDKDGISAAVLFCDLAAAAKANGHTITDLLDDLARRHGVHVTASITVRTDDAAKVMKRLTEHPPTKLAGVDVTVTHQADVLILMGSNDEGWVRLAVRLSGTEPKVKGYIEIGSSVGDRRQAQDRCAKAKQAAQALLRS